MSDVAAIAKTGIITSKDRNGNNITRTATTAERAAAMDRTMQSGGFSQRQDALVAAASGGNSPEALELKSRAVKGAYAKGDQNIYGVGFGDKIVKGQVRDLNGLRAEAVKNAAEGNLRAEHVVENSTATEWLAGQVVDPAVGGGTGTKAAEGFKAAAKTARASDTTRKNINEGGTIDTIFKNFGV